MPLVIVNTKTDLISPKVVYELRQNLPRIVSDALSVEGGPEARLSEDDIEIWFREQHRLDVGSLPLEIVIFANLYSERERGLTNIHRRRDRIIRELRELLPVLELVGDSKDRGFVWILLARGSFGML